MLARLRPNHRIYRPIMHQRLFYNRIDSHVRSRCWNLSTSACTLKQSTALFRSMTISHEVKKEEEEEDQAYVVLRCLFDVGYCISYTRFVC